VRSARSAGCSVVFSEDMKQGQNYEGVLIENPFSG
jgi:predicted nucleic acid-binding protein